MPEDKVFIRDLSARAIIGVNDWERRDKQEVLINIDMTTDISAAAQADDVDASVNYRTVTKKVLEHVDTSSRLTLEALAMDIMKLCLSMEHVVSARVRVEKPGAVRFARSVGVELERRKTDLA